VSGGWSGGDEGRSLGGRRPPPFAGPRRGWRDRPPVLEPVERRAVHEGRIVNLSVDRVRFPDGSEGELEFIRHRGASAVVAYLDPPSDPDPRIVLVHQFRYAAGGDLYEVPAGMPDANADADEGWAEVAARELEEETGYRAEAVHYLGRIYTTPGFTDEVIHLFAATGLRAGTENRDRDEFMEVVVLPLSEAIGGIRSGEIVDGKSVAALLWAATMAPAVIEEEREAPPRG
jgi:ADP-ribose pyrophosphatase